ncbi:MAG: FAD:protein FMN transferase [Woeseiaceae bacterium]
MGALTLVGCERAAQPQFFEWLTFATTLRLTIYGSDEKTARKAQAALKTKYDQINKDWYAWGDGELGRINHELATTSTARVSAPLAQIISTASQLNRQSQNTFSIRTAELSRAWGFDRFDAGNPPQRRPSKTTLAAALDSASIAFRLEDLGMNDDSVRIVAERPGLLLDLGGIAKGAALSVGLRTLRENGVESAMIDAGGDLATLAGTQRSSFTVGLQAPRGSGVGSAIRIAAGECVMTSGDYARYWMIDGQRYQHIIDANTGEPANGAQAATVVGLDPTHADAAATALVVGGAARFDELCDAMQVTDALLVDNKGRLTITPEFRDRLIGQTTVNER